MTGIGTLVNAGAILLGGLLGGLVVPRVPDRVREGILRALGLGVILIGLKMAWPADDRLLLLGLLSLAMGTALGELGDLEGRLQRMAARWETRFGGGGGELGRTLVRLSLLFCVGAMSITGALQDGLHGDPGILYAKAVLDGVTATIFASAVGPGVALTAVPVLLYQGALTLAAGAVAAVLSPAAIAAIGVVGGLLVMAIGISMTGAAEIPVANLLPALVIAVPLATWDPLRYLGL
ncbi:MAG: DUF554 domain-containing protein [Bacillota bacterium]|nr:MAG: DUF554 domain-containing protein [Bacillota bacterium]